MKDVNDLVTATDFREFFAAIPEERWTVKVFDDGHGCHCALGHLGVRQSDRGLTKPAMRLKLIATHLETFVTVVNDKDSPLHRTPRGRILAMLDVAVAKGL